MPSTLRQGLYHADGQILDEVYVYGSFLQSRMYRAGVRCSDCHNVHSLELKASGDALCTRCHRESPDPRFKDRESKRYDAPSHHFHPVDSTGAQCVGCHMPAKTYMVVDPRRDHSFRVPRPDLSVKIGTPNACSLCHQQESPAGAAAKTAEWYGAKRSAKRHYGEVLAAGYSGKPGAESALVDLAADESQPGIVRATAIDQLQGYGTKGMLAIIGALEDPDPMLRAVAAGGLERLPPPRRAEFAAPLLNDPVRAVRVEAGRVLAPLPPDSFEPAQRAKLDQALSEYKAAQYAVSDQPAAKLNLAVLSEGAGNVEAAERAYLKALSIDARFLPARHNLANLYNRVGRNADAEKILRAGIEYAPDEGELNYSLGLVLAEEQKNEQAAHYLGRAATLLPGRGRVRFNYALALIRVGRSAEAERALLEAAALSPADADVLYTLTIHYVNLKRWDRAEEFALRLVRARPDDAGARRLLAQINALRKFGTQ
jgi:tetratricopeptide (TPR) repeat protein